MYSKPFLDNPVSASLSGPHADFAETCGNALRYPADMCPFVGLPTTPSAQDWADLATMVGAGGIVSLATMSAHAPADWPSVFDFPGVQLVDDGIDAAPDDEAVVLTHADVPEMSDLVARTRPGPFLPRTIDMGTYLGIRRDGALVAMAGERLHPPGWTEISAVCTDPAYRGQGLASRLVCAVAHGIRARGETPLMHAAAANTSAVRLYTAMGFRVRLDLFFRGYRVPDRVGVQGATPRSSASENA